MAADPDIVHFVRARERDAVDVWPEVPRKTDMRDWHAAWHASRRLGGYPDLEWTYGVLNARVWALGSAIPAYFYENVTTFDQTRQVVWIAHELRKRGQHGPNVEVGLEFFDAAYRTTTGRLELPVVGESFRGRHAVELVGGCGQETLLFRNSWGLEWGDRGYGYLSREYFEAHVKTVDVRWSSTFGPSPEMTACLRRRKGRSALKMCDFVDCWPTRNRFGVDEFLLGGVQHSLVSWEVNSLETHGLVYIFELRNPARVIGRAHVYAPAEPGSPFTVRELFIDRTKRRRGYGTLLEGAVVGVVEDLGGSELEAWVHKPDAMPRCKAASSGFAAARSYDESDSRPQGMEIATVWKKEIG